jgi:hypothetical protein
MLNSLVALVVFEGRDLLSASVETGGKLLQTIVAREIEPQ